MNKKEKLRLHNELINNYKKYFLVLNLIFIKIRIVIKILKKILIL